MLVGTEDSGCCSSTCAVLFVLSYNEQQQHLNPWTLQYLRHLVTRMSRISHISGRQISFLQLFFQVIMTMNRSFVNESCKLGGKYQFGVDKTSKGACQYLCIYKTSQSFFCVEKLLSVCVHVCVWWISPHKCVLSQTNPVREPEELTDYNKW